MPDENIPRDLGGGLVMRKATFQDRERVADFHANTLVGANETPPLERLRGFVLDLMSGEHPLTGPGDFTIVEDTATGKIVSSMCLMSQTWTYEGIPFAFGQPDIVSTNPDYRRRGLVRAQMDEVHRWSAQRGELALGITGIPWYYRQFGYEMALNLDGHRQGFRSQVPKLKEGEKEQYSLRAATTDDVPFITKVYARATSRSVIASVRSDALWCFDIEGRSITNGFRPIIRVIETLDGEPMGLLVHSRKLWDEVLWVRLFEVVPGAPYLSITPSVMRCLDQTGEEYAKRDNEEFHAISFELGEKHPVYDTLSGKLPVVHKPYAWFIRVPDLTTFVRHIAPALEKRLAESAQGGYTGELRISLYKSGLLMRFERGSISIDAWQPSHIEDGDAAFPDLTFLQLLFGYRSLEELQYAFPDCSASTDAARVLLPILFPRKESNVRSGG